MPDVVEIAQRLIRFDTINPPGRERPCLDWVASLLAPAGFEIAWQEIGEDRANLIARLPATAAAARPPLVLSGHVDTVPLGAAAWSVPTHEGLIEGGRLWGRGASDMKSGVAACIAAGLEAAEWPERRADLRLILSAAEETGCEGVLALVRERSLLGEAGAMVVAEPTDNRPLLGHKGALWLRLHHRGVTAHGSSPELGRNAIFAACESIARLRSLDFGVAEHEVMGRPSLNIGTLHGGLNVNSVPDHAALGVDIRTVAGQTNASVRERVAEAVGGEIEIEILTDMAPVFTPADDPWMAEARTIASEITGAPADAATARYFTDASVLKEAFGHPPTLIMGPGPAALAHQTDEWCDVAAIGACARAFAEIARRYLA
ncbi:MAG TPA: M20 family metallopeptidase [Paracoccaceae bacterium]|nr:M20 family metallopeptidase [Paracoccaceae bacterium]